MKERIKEFLLQEYAIEDFSEPLISSGRIDSFAIVGLLTFLENEFSIKIGMEEVLLENFDTLDKITMFLARKISAIT